MMKSIFKSILIFVLIPLMCACSNSEPIQKEVNGMIFNIPGNWTEKDNGNDYKYYYTPTSDFLMLMRQPIEHELNESTFDIIIEGILKGALDVKLLSNGKKEIGDNTFYFSQNSVTMNDTDYVTEIYGIAKNDNIYIFSMLNKGEQFKYSDDIFTILQSVRFSHNSEITQRNIISTNTKVQNIFQKDTFTDELFQKFTEFFQSDTFDSSFEAIKVKDIESDDRNSIITTYVLSHTIKLVDTNEELYHLSIRTNKENNYIESISIMCDNEKYIEFSYMTNCIALLIDDTIDIDAFDEKCNMLSEEPAVVQEEKFSIFKDTTDDYVSALFTIK